MREKLLRPGLQILHANGMTKAGQEASPPILGLPLTNFQTFIQPNAHFFSIAGLDTLMRFEPRCLKEKFGKTMGTVFAKQKHK